jgi:hypothetical protein
MDDARCLHWQAIITTSDARRAAVAEAAAVEEAVAMVAAVVVPVTALLLTLPLLKPSRRRSLLSAPGKVATRKEAAHRRVPPVSLI